MPPQRGTGGKFIADPLTKLRQQRKAGNVDIGTAKKGPKVTITGQDEIIKNLKRLAKKMKGNLRPCMTEVVTLVQKESMIRTPVKTSNLVGSHRSKVTKDGTSGVIGSVYLLASYALFVHEARKTVRFESPWPKGRKFLERGITDNLMKIIDIIKDWMKK